MTFFVEGIPRPQGSKDPLPGGRMREHSKYVGAWRKKIRQEAAIAWAGRKPICEPVKATLRFFMPRPKRHYRTGKFAGILRDDAPYWHTSTPDIDKLARAVLDALKGVCYSDDARVCDLRADKVYSDMSGVHINIGAKGD